MRSRSERLTDVYGIVVALAIFVPAVLSLAPADGTTSATRFAAERGPAAAGVLVALAVGAGLRSGAFGGPLWLSAPDVSLLLMAPHPHQVLLAHRLRRAGVVVAIASAGVSALAAGAVAPEVAVEPAVLVAGSAVAGALAAAAGFGASLVAARRRLAPRNALIVALALVSVAGVEVAAGSTWLPLSWIGAWATVGLSASPAPLAAGALSALGLLVAGLSLRGDVDLDRVERRSRVMGQAIGAIALQDVRAMLLAIHSRADELARSRPWAKAPPPRRWPAWRRGWHGLLRTSSTRVIRLFALTALAGVAVSTSLTAPATAALAVAAVYLAALDVCEPIGQEIDRPTRRSSYPRTAWQLYSRMAGPSIVTMVVVHLLVAAVVFVTTAESEAGLVLVAVSLPAAVASVAWAVFAFVRGRPDSATNLRFLTDPTGLAIFGYHLTPAVGAGSGVATAVLALHLGSTVDAVAASLFAAALAAGGVYALSRGR